MTPLWTAQDAARATGGTTTSDWQVGGVSIDTRTLQPGDLFVALKAARDGHEFVAQALKAGATAALVTHIPDGVAPDAPLLIVPDVLAALNDLARAARARTSARIVAVTGSVGKTSTKEMLRTVLARQGRTHAAQASYNNHWGVPLTLARMPVDTEFAVIELGMNHPGEIAPLARLTRPHVALITTIAPAHLEAFDDITGIAREKAAIFDGLEPGGTAIINADLDTSDVLLAAARAARAQITTFGHHSTDYTLSEARITNDTTIVQAQINADPVLFKLSCAGRHFAMNGLATLAACDALGADPGRAAPDLALWTPPAGRGTREEITLDAARRGWTFELIDDAFNANPTSLLAALEVLAAATPRDGVGRIPRGRRIAILGDMLELGDDEIALHRDLADLDVLTTLDVVHCVGPRMLHLWEVLPPHQKGTWADMAQEMAGEIHDLIDAGDVVLVKGSKGSQVSLLAEALRHSGRRSSPQFKDD